MSEQSPIDENGKARIKEALLAHLRTGVAALSGDADEKRDAGQLDQDIVLESDDTSHSDEDADLDSLLADSADDRQQVIAEVEALDFSPREDVESGAVVGFGDERYVVGVAVDEFEVEGASYSGISADAPAFAALRGLRAGDTFELGGREQRVQFVV